MIPSLVTVSGLQKLLLPPGIHRATFAEVEAAFAWNDRRRWLFEGLLGAVSALKGVGCGRIYLNGSYTTSKPDPGDYDGCWDPTGVAFANVDPIFVLMPACKAEQKRRYRGELWQGRHDLAGLDAFPNFFQQDDRTGARKGIIEILLT